MQIHGAASQGTLIANYMESEKAQHPLLLARNSPKKQGNRRGVPQQHDDTFSIRTAIGTHLLVSAARNLQKKISFLLVPQHHSGSASSLFLHVLHEVLKESGSFLNILHPNPRICKPDIYPIRITCKLRTKNGRRLKAHRTYF